MSSSTPVGQAAYTAAVTEVVQRLVATQSGNIRAAAETIADAVEAGAVVQAFGTGHSTALAMEVAGRAGGLVPTNMLSLRDGILYGGDSPQALDPLAERDPETARRIYDLAPIGPADPFVIASSSGGNGSTVEMAVLAKERGHRVIAFTSLDHSRQVVSRHPSGRRLFEVADVVIDNCAPFGDAVLPLPGGGSVCAVSSVTAAMAAQMMTADAVGLLVARGHKPPVYLSANVPGGDEHNQELEARYAGRIRRDAA
ncbi:MAG: SIS domain-containing protein [Streptomyces sp.]|jgi:uncharacterized phosphosugar-binding protein|nr:SIS domain-containing protein [Streptomyces sp.]